MDDFKNWLVNHKQLNSESARVYASRVSTMLKNLPGDTLTEEVVKCYLDMPEHGPTRTAYKSFRQFLLQEEGTKLPVYTASQRQRGAVGIPASPVPAEVLDAIITLEKAGIRRKEASHMYWGHLVQLPGEAVETLKAYAEPEEGREMVTPLIPASPGSITPVNWRWLKQVLAVRTRSRQMS
jgi:hypothetical protein